MSCQWWAWACTRASPPSCTSVHVVFSLRLGMRKTSSFIMIAVTPRGAYVPRRSHGRTEHKVCLLACLCASDGVTNNKQIKHIRKLVSNSGSKQPRAKSVLFLFLPIQLLIQSTGFDEMWYECYVLGGHSTLTRFTFLSSSAVRGSDTSAT
jgi:hypothetical protein